MKTAAVFLLLVLALPWPSAHAEEVEVAVTLVREGDALIIDAIMHVPVAPQEAWAVLADFDHFADFVPNMQFSRSVSKPGEPLRIEQKGKARYGLLSFSYESLREVELLPYETLKSRVIKGNMKKMETLTRLSGENGGTRIHYHNEAVPDFWLPPLIGPAFIRHEVAEQFRAFIREMLRRNPDAPTKH
jgi:hypothetical protein